MESRDIEKAIAESLQTAKDFEQSITFASLAEAYEKMNELDSGWIKGMAKHNICFFHINESEDNLQPKLSVLLSEKLTIRVFFDHNKVKQILCSDKSAFKFPLTVTDIHTLHKVLSESKNKLLDDMQNSDPDRQSEKFKYVLDILQSICEGISEDKKQILHFIQEQLSLLLIDNKNLFRYSYELSLFACLLHSISPHAYKYLRSCNKLILPSPHALKTICASLKSKIAKFLLF